MSLRTRAHKAGVGTAVLGLHLVGLLTWWAVERGLQPPRRALEPDVVVAWLPALSPVSTLPAKQQKPREQQQQPGLAEAPRQADSSIAQPAPAVAMPAITAPAQSAPERDTPLAPMAPASALNLSLSSKSLATLSTPGFAAKSAFQGRLPATVERQVALAFAETGPWTEERIDNDHIRFRRGNTCVTMSRPQAAIIDPFSEASGRLPWRASVSDCY